jgi:hypothetical protein
MIFVATIPAFFGSKSDEVDRVIIDIVGGVAILVQPNHARCLKIYAKIATPLREGTQSWHTDKRPEICPLTYVIRFSLAVEEEAWSTGGVSRGPNTTRDCEKEVPGSTRSIRNY